MTKINQKWKQHKVQECKSVLNNSSWPGLSNRPIIAMEAEKFHIFQPESSACLGWFFAIWPSVAKLVIYSISGIVIYLHKIYFWCWFLNHGFNFLLSALIYCMGISGCLKGSTVGLWFTSEDFKILIYKNVFNSEPPYDTIFHAS